MTSALFAALLAGCAAALLGRGPGARWLHRLRPPVQAGPLRLPGGPDGRAALVALVGGTAAALALRTPVPALLAVPVALFSGRRRRHRDAVRRAGSLRTGTAELCTALAAELRSGRTPAQALVGAADAVSGESAASVAGAVAVARVGGDVPAALDTAAGAAGAEGLRRIAACWRVAADNGAGLAPALDRVASGLRAEDDTRQEIAGELAGARTTARLLAVLPAFGVLLGTGLGADPLRVLLRTPYGIGCLVLGLLLIAAGTAWTDRLADREAG